jgi:cellobiose phosphorylase
VREAKWSHGQFLSFVSYDSSVGERFPALGGYCWHRFSGREVAENLLVLKEFHHGLGRSSIRWLSKTQLASGDIPKDHAYVPETKESPEFESDLEIWYVLGVSEFILSTGNVELLDDALPFWDDGHAPLFEHLVRAYRWTVSAVGIGDHGLIKMADGDWNDYLSGIGKEGYGESLMNSGMAARAYAKFAELCRIRGENGLASELEERVAALRDAVGRLFTGRWFVRGFDDAGNVVGGDEDGVCFLNAQSWAILGECGTAEQRIASVRAALRECAAPFGLSVVSSPYPYPPPTWLSKSPVPQGEGENGGIWPQTVHWLIWALCELGMTAKARSIWRRSSFRRHTRLYPDAPFGIFNGPDNYSSADSDGRAGRTQLIGWDRTNAVPMQPAVAWQAFSLKLLAETRVGKTHG